MDQPYTFTWHQTEGILEIALFGMCRRPMWRRTTRR